MLECPKCRRTFQSGTRFCGSCGTALSGTIPAVVSQNRGHMEPLARSQNVPGFQAKDSPEDTIMRKKPDGFSWQFQSTNLLDNEPQQTSGLACAAVDEATVSFTKSTLPCDSAIPTVSNTSIPPSLPTIHAVHI